jgi:hypothetical protein
MLAPEIHFSSVEALGTNNAAKSSVIPKDQPCRAYSLYIRDGATATAPTPTVSGIQYVLDSTIVPSSGPFNYIGKGTNRNYTFIKLNRICKGCYNDPSAANRALQDGANFQSQSMTVDACADFCAGCVAYIALTSQWRRTKVNFPAGIDIWASRTVMNASVAIH